MWLLTVCAYWSAVCKICAWGIAWELEAIITEVHAKMPLNSQIVYAYTVYNILGKPLCVSYDFIPFSPNNPLDLVSVRASLSYVNWCEHAQPWSSPCLQAGTDRSWELLSHYAFWHLPTHLPSVWEYMRVYLFIYF